jgi:hypothetical protein
LGLLTAETGIVSVWSHIAEMAATVSSLSLVRTVYAAPTFRHPSRASKSTERNPTHFGSKDANGSHTKDATTDNVGACAR